jgi:hypothetical protein
MIFFSYVTLIQTILIRTVEANFLYNGQHNYIEYLGRCKLYIKERRC